MELLNAAFLGTFVLIYSALYPIFKQPIFATYLVIFLIIIAVIIRLFLFLKNQTLFGKKSSGTIKVAVLWLVEIYLVFMLFWYIFVHFKTYKLMT